MVVLESRLDVQGKLLGLEDAAHEGKYEVRAVIKRAARRVVYCGMAYMREKSKSVEETSARPSSCVWSNLELLVNVTTRLYFPSRSFVRRTSCR